MAYQHIAFSMTFKNIDAADPLCGFRKWVRRSV